MTFVFTKGCINLRIDDEVKRGPPGKRHVAKNSINIGRVGSWASRGIASVGIYGVVQKAAASAHRLNFTYPAYCAALYAQELEMMVLQTSSPG